MKNFTNEERLARIAKHVESREEKELAEVRALVEDIENLKKGMREYKEVYFRERTERIKEILSPLKDLLSAGTTFTRKPIVFNMLVKDKCYMVEVNVAACGYVDAKLNGESIQVDSVDGNYFLKEVDAAQLKYNTYLAVKRELTNYQNSTTGEYLETLDKYSESNFSKLVESESEKKLSNMTHDEFIGTVLDLAFSAAAKQPAKKEDIISAEKEALMSRSHKTFGLVLAS